MIRFECKLQDVEMTSGPLIVRSECVPLHDTTKGVSLGKNINCRCEKYT